MAAAQPKQLGKAHIYGTKDIALAHYTGATLLNLVGWVQPNLDSLSLSHDGTIDRVIGTDGKTNALIGEDDVLQCSFEFVPQASSVDAAATSAYIPGLLSTVVITGAQIIPIGPWTDALNVNEAGGSPQRNRWVYQGGAKINGSNKGKWTMTLPLFRYVAITGNALMS